MYERKGNQNRSCIAAICKGCGLEFSAIAYEVSRGGGKFCSRNCSRSFQAKVNANAMKTNISRKERNALWKASVPKDVHMAHYAVQVAISNGSLKREPCEKCGATRVDAHHDDYSKPLSVRWLCRGHHIEHHRKTSPIQ